MNKLRIDLRSIILLLSSFTAVTPSAMAEEKPDGGLLILTVGRPTVVSQAQPPDTTRAAVEQTLRIMSLAEPPLRMCVVVYGKESVVIAAGDDGKPTTSLAQLRTSLNAAWVAASSQNPMDRAFGEIQRLVTAEPKGTPVTVVHLGAGIPDSGVVRSNEFEDVAAAIEKERERILQGSGDFSDVIRQAKLARFEQELKDTSTQATQDMLLIQRPLELVKTSEHAAVLKSRDVRMVTVRYDSSETLAQIHEQSGGTPDNLLSCTPGQTLTVLLRLLRQLPGVIALGEQEHTPVAQTFAADVDVPVEGLAEEIIALVEFEPPISDWSTHCLLKARLDGSEYVFDLAARQDEDAALLLDAEGNVAGAALHLPAAPSSPQIALHWESPSATLAVPAMRVHSFCRARSDLRTVFGPSLWTDTEDSRLPLTVSPDVELAWKFALRVGDQPNPWPVDRVEVTLKNTRSDATVSLPFRADPQAPHTFLCEPTAIPEGTWDVQTMIGLPSGLLLQSTTRGAIISVRTEEIVSIEIEQAGGEDAESGSVAPGFFHAADLGDDLTRWTMPFVLRSQVDYPLAVTLETTLADPEGQVPRRMEDWLSISPRRELLLMPGRPESIRLVATIPDDVEAALIDGLYEGELIVRKSDTQLPLHVVPFEALAGAGDEPCTLIRFSLQRPKPGIELPFAMHNWMRRQRDGSQMGLIQVSIAQPFSRRVRFNVHNTSRQLRVLSLDPQAALFNQRGMRETEVRLIPLSENLNVEFQPNETRSFDFLMEVGSNVLSQTIKGGLHVRGDGVVDQYFPLRIELRTPLLGDLLRRVAWWIGLVLVVRGVLHLWNWRHACRFRTGLSGSIRRLGAIIRLTPAGRGCLMQVRQPIEVLKPGSRRPETLHPGQTVQFPPEMVCGSQGLNIKTRDASIRIEDVDVDPDTGVVDARYEIEDGGENDRVASRSGRGLMRTIVVVGFLAFVAENLSRSFVALAAQWVYDLITG